MEISTRLRPVSETKFLGKSVWPLCFTAEFAQRLGWAKSRDSYRRIASDSESCRRDSNHWRSLAVISPPKEHRIGPRRPRVRCTAIRIARLAFIGVVFVPRGTAEWLARVDCVRPSKPSADTVLIDTLARKADLTRILNV